MTKEELENVFREKYGPMSLVDIGAFWNTQKDKILKEYLRIEQKYFLSKEDNYFKFGSILFSNKFSSKENKCCLVCGRYNYKARDLKTFSLFRTCFDCHVRHIEGREERWKAGWRPTI